MAAIMNMPPMEEMKRFVPHVGWDSQAEGFGPFASYEDAGADSENGVSGEYKFCTDNAFWYYRQYDERSFIFTHQDSSSGNWKNQLAVIQLVQKAKEMEIPFSAVPISQQDIIGESFMDYYQWGDSGDETAYSYYVEIMRDLNCNNKHFRKDLVWNSCCPDKDTEYIFREAADKFWGGLEDDATDYYWYASKDRHDHHTAIRKDKRKHGKSSCRRHAEYGNYSMKEQKHHTSKRLRKEFFVPSGKSGFKKMQDVDYIF